MARAARRPGPARGSRSTSPSSSHGLGLRARHPRPGPGADVRRAAGGPPPAARARPGRDRAARSVRGRIPSRWLITNNCTPVLAGQRRRGRPRPPPTSTTGSTTGCSSTRCCSAATRTYSPGRRWSRRRPGRRPRRRSAPARRARRQLLQPDPDRRAHRATRAALRGAGRSPATRPPPSAGPSSPTACANCWSASRRRYARRPPADLRHRDRLLASTTSAPTRTAGRRPAPGSTTSTATCGPWNEAIGRGRRRARLLRLVAAGQLRVGRGLQPALRPGPRRLRHPAAARPSAPSTGTGSSSPPSPSASTDGSAAGGWWRPRLRRSRRCWPRRERAGRW